MTVMSRMSASAEDFAVFAAYRAALLVCNAQFRPRTLTGLHARRRAIYLCVVHYGISHASVGRAAGLHRGAVSRIVSTIETQRDDPTLDRHLDDLEMELML